MIDEKAIIIEYTKKVIFSKDVQSITMDEISKGLRMSKKTLYKHFESKDQLIEVVIGEVFQMIRGQIKTASTEGRNSIEKIIKVITVVIGILSKIDLNKFKNMNMRDREIWDKIDEFRKKTFVETFTNLFEQGKNEGCIIDKPTDILITVGLAVIRSVVVPEFLINHNYSFQTAAKHAMEILMNGYLTPKGKEIYEQLSKGI